MARTASLLAGGAICAGLAAVPALATSLTVEPATQTVPVGSVFEVAVQISGLGSGSPASLGAFDLNLNFDPSKVSYVSVAFGDPVLGDALGPVFGSLDAATPGPGAGSVNLFGVSLDLPATLDGLQPGAFTLATIRFSALAGGSSGLDLANVILGDAAGSPLAADRIQGATVMAVAGVPDQGGSLALLLLVLGALAAFRGFGAADHLRRCVRARVCAVMPR